MPDITQIDCWDTAVLWPAYGADVEGQPLYLAPVELKPPNGVRWLDKQAWVIGPNGNTLLVDATAIIAAQIDIPIHSKMWLGKLADWYGTGSADTVDQYLMVVKSFNKTPDQQRRFYRRTVGLMRYHNKP